MPMGSQPLWLCNNYQRIMVVHVFAHCSTLNLQMQPLELCPQPVGQRVGRPVYSGVASSMHNPANIMAVDVSEDAPAPNHPTQPEVVSNPTGPMLAAILSTLGDLMAKVAKIRN